MNIIKNRGLNSNQIKFIAIIAMTIDHITWLLYPGCQKIWWVMGLHSSDVYTVFTTYFKDVQWRTWKVERNEVVLLYILSCAFVCYRVSTYGTWEWKHFPIKERLENCY